MLKIKEQRRVSTGKVIPCPFTGPKIVCAGPNFFCQNKIDLRSVQIPLWSLIRIQFLVWPKTFCDL
jgi:hypothetical protein